MVKVRRAKEKRKRELTLHVRLGRPYKANWRSLAPCGRKVLSAHWFLHLAKPSGRHPATCAAGREKNFPS
jgi:hypothetical protein